jgi:hypothetical protein
MMRTVNSISGGMTSAYIAKHHPADYNIFSLVRSNDKSVIFKDKKLRQLVSDKIGEDFIGTLEDDKIIYTILELEQYIGKEIVWLTGEPFEEVIKNYRMKNGGYFLPNQQIRYCTTDMKLTPIKEWWYQEIREIVDMRIGFRCNEKRRADTMEEKYNKNGFHEDKFVVGRHKKSGNRKWKTLEWRKCSFPLIVENINKNKIMQYWKDKPVTFADYNNCIMCFHRSPLFLNKMARLHPRKAEWFAKMEKISGSQFRKDVSMREIINFNSQYEINFDDFSSCDSGFCGI